MSLNVIALGGNAILDPDPTDEGQKAVVNHAAKYIAEFIAKGEEVIVCHGNGPQVGNLLLQQKAAESEKNPAMKLDTCVAMTEGSIGYWLQNALINEFAKRNLKQPVLSVVTQVRVDPKDPSFKQPSKPIGPFYTKEEAQNKLGLSKRITNLVLPLGMSLNSNGSAMHMAITVMTIAQMYQMEFNLTKMVYLAIAATFVSLANAVVPGAGLVSLAVIVPQMGLPVESIAIFAGVEWFVGMLRTILNVNSDVYSAIFVAKSVNKLDYAVFNKKNE